MAMKLYVGNLPYTATEASVRELFSQHGTVLSVVLPTDRETGSPRGFGFVEMENAQQAMTALDGQEFGGRALRINEARERTDRGPGGDRGGDRGARPPRRF